MTKKKTEKEQSSIHKDLKGFDIHINELGEIVSNLNVDKINEFLNRSVNDKKLKNLKLHEEGEEE